MKRTSQQNNAMHLYFRLLAEALDAAGYDIKTTLKEDFELPWNDKRVKELIWHPVQWAMTDKDSTAKLDKLEVDDIYKVIDREIAKRTGVSVAFPSESDLSDYEGWR